MVIWSTTEFGFVRLSDAFTTGSSIMPQKKNPDMAELARGKTGRVYGTLMSLLTTMKGLPLAYNRDMQEDKEPLFDAASTLGDTLAVLAAMTSEAEYDAERMASALQKDFASATELADYLVRKGMPFREAHEIVGRVVRYCVDRASGFEILDAETLRDFSDLFDADALECLDAASSVALKRSAGSTSPEEVDRQISAWKKVLESS
jgi:argininosuccinate lyase